MWVIGQESRREEEFSEVVFLAEVQFRVEFLIGESLLKVELHNAVVVGNDFELQWRGDLQVLLMVVATG